MPPRTSELFTLLADECEELDLLPVDDGGLFAPSDHALAEDLRGLAAALAQATTRAAQGLGVALREYPPISVMSQPAWADDEPGLVVRMITMVVSAQDPAWDAAARMDLPGAIGRMADALRELESSGRASNTVARDLVDTAQHVCSLLQVLAGLVETAATTSREL